MRRIVKETLRAVTPHVIPAEPGDGWPEADPAEAVEFLDEWFEKGIPEFSTLTTAAFCLLNVCSLVFAGRTFPRLGFDRQAVLMRRLYRLKGPLAFLFLYFLTAPVVNSYFSRVDVQVKLGFDIPSLLEESRLRRVTRGNTALPGKDPAAPAGNGAEGDK